MTHEELRRKVGEMTIRAFLDPACTMPALTPSERVILSALQLEWECEEIAEESVTDASK